MTTQRDRNPAAGPPAHGERLPTVLLADHDDASRSNLERILSESELCSVAVARSGAEAFDILGRQLVDVIVAATSGRAGDGFRILDHVRHERHLRDIPVILLSEDDRLTSKTAAFEMGATDYVTRPYRLAELTARIFAALRRRLARRHSSPERGSTLAGDFSGLAFTDLIHLLQIGRRSGVLSVYTPRVSGELTFVDGMVYHATCGNLEGETAFYHFMHATEGQFEFEPTSIDIKYVRNTIALSPTALLMEGARQLDSWRRDHPDEAPPEPEPDAAASDAGLIGELPPVHPGEPPSAALRDDLVSMLEGGALGELRLHARDELRGWTAPRDDHQRCHVLLVADTRDAIRAMTSVAKPLSPEQIEAALDFDQKVLGLSWRTGAGHQLLDVLLLSQDYPGFVLNELQLAPAALVLAPRRGDWLSLPVHALQELECVATRLRPKALLGLGNASLEEGLGYFRERTGIDVKLGCHGTALDDPGADLRAGLCEALRLWAEALAVVEG